MEHSTNYINPCFGFGDGQTINLEDMKLVQITTNRKSAKAGIVTFEVLFKSTISNKTTKITLQKTDLHKKFGVTSIANIGESLSDEIIRKIRAIKDSRIRNETRSYQGQRVVTTPAKHQLRPRPVKISVVNDITEMFTPSARESIDRDSPRGLFPTGGDYVFHTNAFNYIAEKGALRICQYMIGNCGFREFNLGFWRTAIRHNQVEILRLATKSPNNASISALYSAVLVGRTNPVPVPILDVIKGTQGLPPDFAGFCRVAATHENLKALKWAKENGHDMRDRGILLNAIATGNLTMVMWIINLKTLSDFVGVACYQAAKFNHIHILKWFKEQGFHFGEYVIEGAACGMNQEDFKWVLDNTSSFNPACYASLVRRGDLELLNLAGSDRIYGYKKTTDLFEIMLATYSKQRSLSLNYNVKGVLQWLLDNGWQINSYDDLMDLAVQYNCDVIINWLWEQDHLGKRKYEIHKLITIPMLSCLRTHHLLNEESVISKSILWNRYDILKWAIKEELPLPNECWDAILRKDLRLRLIAKPCPTKNELRDFFKKIVKDAPSSKKRKDRSASSTCKSKNRKLNKSI